VFNVQKVKDLEELCREYQGKISQLEERPKEVFTVLRPPEAGDNIEFYRSIATLIDNKFLLFFLEQMRREFIEQFEVSGKELSEYYRGKLAAIGDLIKEARSAKKKMQEASFAPQVS
jgi:hypothetical protein